MPSASLVLTSLDDLARTANSEHELVCRAAESLVEHAIRCGDALLAAQARVAWGDWTPWLEANLAMTPNAANRYMLLATHRERIFESGVDSIRAATLLLRREGLTRGPHRGTEGKEVRQRALALGDEGMHYTEVAELFGVSKACAWNWLNPERAKAKQRLASMRHAERKKAEEGRRRDASVKRMGGDVSHAYALLRRALQMLDRAAERERDTEVKRAIGAAIHNLHEGEDHLVRASKIR